jgi:hypothetical protein
MSFVRIKLAGVGSFAKLETRGDDDIADLAKRACSEFSHWGVNPGQVSLYLVSAGGEEEPTEKDIMLCRRLGVGKSLTREGISSSAWLLARVSDPVPPLALAASAPLTPKKFFLVVNDTDKYGEVVPKSLDVTISTQGELKELVKSHGGGSLVQDDTAVATRKVEDLVNGGIYTLIGGQQEAVKRHTTWTQQADKLLEEAATVAVRDVCEKTLGKLGMSNNITYTNALNEKQEFDGLLNNNNDTVIVVEAKHVSQPEHVDLVLDKASFLLQCAREGKAEELKGITNVVPVLASSRFSPSMIALCKARCVGVVKPNGSGYTYIPFTPHPSHFIGRTRSFYTLARVLRVLL